MKYALLILLATTVSASAQQWPPTFRYSEAVLTSREQALLKCFRNANYTGDMRVDGKALDRCIAGASK